MANDNLIPNNWESWWLYARYIDAISDRYVPDTKIEGINIHPHSGEDVLLDYCQTHGITPEELDDTPAYLRERK